MSNSEALRQLLEHSGIPSGSETAEQFLGYLALLEKWNPRINLTSSTDWDSLAPLFREAIKAAHFYPEKAVSHLDIGSGGGFPAILLKMLLPRIRLDMVESRGKKGVFLETVAHSLKLENVAVHGLRLVDFVSQIESSRVWDCISWKAIKLTAEDLSALRPHAHQGAQFWMFHGKEPALADTTADTCGLVLIRKERFPDRRESHLSIYAPA